VTSFLTQDGKLGCQTQKKSKKPETEFGLKRLFNQSFLNDLASKEQLN
jgi:hypothetical protein